MALISLLGVVVMQVYWVKNAFDLKEEQFNQSVGIAMKTVLNRILELNTDENLRRIALREPCVDEKTDIRDVIAPRLLDSLIRMEFKCLKVSRGYEYAIYNKKTNKLVFGNFRQYPDQILLSPYQQSVEALFKPGAYYLSIYFPQKTSGVIMQLLGWMILSALFMVAVLASFWITLRTVYRQKKWSEMKTDFINNMTHEFKTPISTIGVASEMLLKDEVNTQAARVLKYVGIILSENNRLQNQVEQVLQSAMLEKGNIQLRMKSTDVHRLIAQTVNSFQLRIQEREGTMHTALTADNYHLTLDRLHITNVLANLIDNALKYSPSKPEITISCYNQKTALVIEVQDKGLGINKESQKHIFKNFYRVHTGNIHDVKGFGIGLFYVKRIVELHGGSVELESEPGLGSTFRLFLPLKSIHNTGGEHGNNE